jgi:hypothetical protein
MRRLALLAAIAWAAPAFAQNAPRLLEIGHDHIYNLEYDEAIATFERAIGSSPDVPDLHNALAEALVFREMYRNGALESELVSGNNSFLRRPKLNPSAETEKRFFDALAQATALAEARLAKNARDTDAMYALGITCGLRANYLWVVR